MDYKKSLMIILLTMIVSTMIGYVLPFPLNIIIAFTTGWFIAACENEIYYGLGIFVEKIVDTYKKFMYK